MSKPVLGGGPTNSRFLGITVIEVIVALAILAIVTAAVTTTYVSSIRNNSDAGRRTQGSLLLNSVGRRVAGAEPGFAPGAQPLVVNYGEIYSRFPELTREQGMANADHFRFTVTNLGPVTLAGAGAIRYSIEVCTSAAGTADERCVRGETAGPEPVDEDGQGGPLEGAV